MLFLTSSLLLALFRQPLWRLLTHLYFGFSVLTNLLDSDGAQVPVDGIQSLPEVDDHRVAVCGWIHSEDEGLTRVLCKQQGFFLSTFSTTLL